MSNLKWQKHHLSVIEALHFKSSEAIWMYLDLGYSA